MEMKTDFSKVVTTENGKVSENEEMKNGTADVTQENDYSIAIVTNQF